MLKILLLGLTANGMIFVYNLYKEVTAPIPTINQDQGITECCKQICDQENKSHGFLKTENIKKVLLEMPALDPSYLRNTLVRLGCDLNIDLSTCPNDSLMLHANRNFIPKHLDCPTLFLIGARKGGTSSLYHYISKHPDFRGTKLDAGPKAGETFYFTTFYTKRSWNRYLSLFPRGGVMTGEASVGNFVHPLAPRRLHESCWKLAKVVILLRDPISRFRSNFLMRTRLKIGGTFAYSSISLYLRKQLNEFLNKLLRKSANLKEVKQEWSKFVGLFGPAENLIYEGLYYVHLMNWLCNFPSENIMIINSQEFYRNPSTILDLVFQFLNLKRLDADTYKWITLTTYNKGKYSNISASQKMSHSDEVLLMGTYRPYNQALIELLQWDSINWNK